MIQSAYDIVTYLLEWSGGSADTRALSMAKRAVQEARRIVANEKHWTYYDTQGRLVTEASYSTGTVVYDYTGGANERMLTLTGGTWPTNAADGVVWIGRYTYRVDQRISDTVITLSEVDAPTSDISSTAYTWFKDFYLLPADCRAIGALIEPYSAIDVQYVSMQRLQEFYLSGITASTPIYYAIGNPDGYDDRIGVRFYPPPAAEHKFNYIYQRRPLPLNNVDYSDGTVSLTSGSAVVTGTGTTFASSMVGDVFRVGTATSKPTDFSGANPPAFESRIRSFTSATSVTLYDAADANYTGKKYRVSDFWDIEDGALAQAVYRCAEWQYALMMARSDVELCEKNFRKALLMAREADSRSFSVRQAMIPLEIKRFPYSLS